MEKIQKFKFKRLNTQVSKRLGFAVLVLIFTLIPLVVHNQYIIHLMIMIAIYSVMAMNFILLYQTGLISLAIGGFWGVGAYASALLSMKLGLKVWLAMPASTIITAIVALIVGFVLIRKGGIGFVMLTLAFAFIVVQIFGSFRVFGARIGLYNIPPPESIRLPCNISIAFTSKVPYYYLALFIVVIVILVILGPAISNVFSNIIANL